MKISLFCVCELAFSYGEKIGFYFKQAVGSDMPVQFWANIFNTQMDDVSNHFRQFISSPSVAPSLINDCFTLLHAISKGMMGELMELKDIYSVTCMGADILEADLMNTIAKNQTGVPPFSRAAVTGVYTGTSTGPKHRLKGVPTYAAWDILDQTMG